MPRISADALAVVPAYKVEFPPPAHLNDAEATVFRDVVATADRGHFRPEDRELLALYCVHVVEARRLMARKRRTIEQQRDLRSETALVMSLSTKLRLGPKSRAPDHRRAASAGGFRPPSYYEIMAMEREKASTAESTAESTGRGLGDRWTR